MTGFLDRIFGSKIEVDLVRAELESRLSFSRSQIDEILLREYIEADRLESLTKYQQECLNRKINTPVTIADEVGLLETYINLFKMIKGNGFYMQFNAKIDTPESAVQPFIIFPLVQNAIKNGYSSLEKYPIKVRISASENGILLEVSNRVNHYVENQGEDELVKSYKQRLLLHYPDKHELFINNNSNTFKATLFLKY